MLMWLLLIIIITTERRFYCLSLPRRELYVWFEPKQIAYTWENAVYSEGYHVVDITQDTTYRYHIGYRSIITTNGYSIDYCLPAASTEGRCAAALDERESPFS